MRVGVPTKVKTDEYRVALTPAGVRELVDVGHEVLIQSGAGVGSAISDDAYAAQGAAIVPDADAVFAGGELIVKVKEPQPQEVERLEAHHTLFTYLHLAAEPALTQGLVESGATYIAYETVEDARGRLPLLAPMSEVAGKIATQAGAFVLEKPLGGRGILLGGVPGVAAANVMVIAAASSDACGVHRDGDGGDRLRVRPQPRSPARAGHRVRRPRRHLLCLDPVDRGAAPRHGPRDRSGAGPRRPGAPRDHALATRSDEAPRGACRRLDRPGRLFETSHPTTHSNPTYEVDGITHYCVANMPGAVPITSTYALTNATMPYVLDLASAGVADAVADNPGLKLSVNVAAGHVTYGPVADATGFDYVPVNEALGVAA